MLTPVGGAHERACGALRLVGGLHNNVGGHCGNVRHNSSNVRGVTAGKVGHNIEL